MTGPTGRPLAGLALVVAAIAGSACALQPPGGDPATPPNRTRRALEALDRDAFAVARHELYVLASRCEAGDDGRRALLLLAATELDPSNPYGSPSTAAHAAASYLLLPDGDEDQVPVARSLYRIAVDLGGSPDLPQGGGSTADFALLPGRYDTCDAGAAVDGARALPHAPAVTTAGRARARELDLAARGDSLEALEGELAASHARIEELEAEIERITALLTAGTRARSGRGRR